MMMTSFPPAWSCRCRRRDAIAQHVSLPDPCLWSPCPVEACMRASPSPAVLVLRGPHVSCVFEQALYSLLEDPEKLKQAVDTSETSIFAR
jgi:hypothetical protein